MISLEKGDNLNLSTTVPNLNRVFIGLGWAERILGEDFDLDAVAFMLKKGQVRNDQDFIFYNQLRSPCGAIVHQGDDLTGSTGETDNEVITVELNKIPAEIDSIVIAASIYKAEEREKNFGMVSQAFIRLVDMENDKEILRYDLNEQFSDQTAVIFGELKRQDEHWLFNAIGEGVTGGLISLARKYGVNV